ncbi:ADP-ribosylglycohydrolase family protein [Zoogloea sp.]|uniref:ADP-ribosylglycohydrolase family protein n=1 Tax=Zoogloea sp. TaxID=49181 RepID=UPI0035B3B04A
MIAPTPDQFAACFLGLALGDAWGAPFEGGPLERLLWRLIGTTRQGARRWTDDTQMSMDVAESLLACGRLDQADLARRFAHSYHWSRGYGPGAARVLKRIRRGQDWQSASRAVYRDGSYGNGGAMRAPILALFCARQPDALAETVRQATLITHAHPLGIEGAQLVARATALALAHTPPDATLATLSQEAQHAPFAQKLALATHWLAQGTDVSPKTLAASLGNGIAAADACISAIFIALHFAERPFKEMLDFVARCGGDTDTLGAMAGALWGAHRGTQALPEGLLARLEQRARIETLGRRLHGVGLDGVS